MVSKEVSAFAARTAIGPFGSRMKSDAYTEVGVPVIRGTNLTGGKILSGEWVYVSEKTADDLSNCCVYPGDLVFPHRGAIGEVGIVPNQFPRYVMSSSLMTISCDRSKADPDYVYYFFKSPNGRHELLKNASQVGTPGIGQPLSTLRSIKVPLPSPNLQRVIAKTLSDLDSKIDLNHRINQTLEAMAQAIFKSWFIDFDPVKARIAAIEQGQDPLRAAMRAISGKTDAELDQIPREYHDQLAATAALFPDAMEESELGGIPKGWNSVPFGCLLSHTIGGDWGTEAPDTVNDTRVAIIRGTDIPDLDQAQLSRVPIRYTNKKKLATRRLQVGDIVLEVSGGSKDQPTGRSFHMTANALREFDCPVEPASFCRLLRPVSLEVGVVLSLHLSWIYKQGKTWEYQNQSTGIANFQTSHFLEAELVVVPPNSVLEVFFGMISPILERRHDAQGRKLALTRDTLLPKLMSGEILVSCQLNEDAQ